MKTIRVLGSVCLIVGTFFSHSVPAAEPVVLPVGSHPAAIVESHFPTRMHQFIFTNWSLVPVERLAAVLETTPERVEQIAHSMGLSDMGSLTPEQMKRGYITVLRRNWQLLPYDQILTLLGMTPEELAFSLREDDFLYVKLGSLKPACEPITYVEPTPEVAARAEQIRQWVEADFASTLMTREAGTTEPRFAFIEKLSRTTKPLAQVQSEIAARPAGMGSPRYLYSYFAMFGDPLMHPELDLYPDGYLEKLAAVGVDGIWMHVVLRQLAPGGEFADAPEFGKDHETRIANLRKLVERANHYGIKFYLYMNEPRAMPLSFYEKYPAVRGVQEGDYAAMCTSDPDGKTLRWLENSLAYLFEKVPGLGGIFTITGSENLTHCASHNQWSQCPRCKTRTDDDLIVEVNAAMERGVHRSAPDAKVIVWDWGWKGHGLAPSIIERLPKQVSLMSVSEWALPIERGGVKSTVGEYSLSAVGPGPRATAEWKTALDCGLSTVAKVQLNCTWELSSMPYLPVVDLVARHCKRLSEAGVSGIMLGWSLGGYPSPNLEVAYEFAKTPLATEDDVLQRVAEHRFGTNAAPLARSAWSKMSAAFEAYPYGGGLYTAPTQMGPANRFYSKSTGYDATMVGLPYDAISNWCAQYPPEVFASQFEKVASGWQEGVAILRQAVEQTDAEHYELAVSELRFAEAAGLHFASVARQVRFVLLRNALAEACYPIDTPLTETQRSAMPQNVATMRTELRSLVEAEITDAKRLYLLDSADSRIGYEASNHYFYVPIDLIEKVISCRSILQNL